MNKIHIYVTTWNSSAFIEDLINWYRTRFPDCPITIYDNMSSDLTVEICKSLDCEVISFNTMGTMDEKTLINIRELCWLNPNHDSEWVIVCDDDEYVDVTPEQLDGTWNVNKCIGYEIFGQDGDSFEELIYGLPSDGYSKQVLFNRHQIKRMNFGAGSHQANPEPKQGFEVIYNPNPCPLYHMKWRGWEAGLNRQKSIAPRISEDSKKKGWNFHYGLPEKLEQGQTGLNHWDYYNNGLTNRIKVR